MWDNGRMYMKAFTQPWGNGLMYMQTLFLTVALYKCCGDDGALRSLASGQQLSPAASGIPFESLPAAGVEPLHHAACVRRWAAL